jgi:hypothetical protein
MFDRITTGPVSTCTICVRCTRIEIGTNLVDAIQIFRRIAWHCVRVTIVAKLPKDKVDKETQEISMKRNKLSHCRNSREVDASHSLFEVLCRFAT